MIDNFHTPIKASFEVLALAGVIGTLIGWLPYLAAGLSVLWYLYSFWKEFR